MTSEEEIKNAIFRGKVAKHFLDYMQRPITEEERQELKEAYEYYKRHEHD